MCLRWAIKAGRTPHTIMLSEVVEVLRELGSCSIALHTYGVPDCCARTWSLKRESFREGRPVGFTAVAMLARL